MCSNGDTYGDASHATRKSAITSIVSIAVAFDVPAAAHSRPTMACPSALVASSLVGNLSTEIFWGVRISIVASTQTLLYQV